MALVWRSELLGMVANPRNVVVANNGVIAKLGIGLHNGLWQRWKKVAVVPNLCLYPRVHYNLDKRMPQHDSVRCVFMETFSFFAVCF